MVGCHRVLHHQQRKLVRVPPAQLSVAYVKELMGQHYERLFGLLTVSRAMATASDVQTVLDCICKPVVYV
jgi:hypothetical protein